MRRLAACFALPLVSFLALGAGSTGAAETSVSASTPAQQGVILRLVHQTPWNTPRHKELHLTVRATNRTEDALDGLSLTVTIFTRVGSRSEYELSLRDDTGNTLFANTSPEHGSLGTGRTRLFRLPPTHLTDAALFGENAVYPMKIELRSHDETVATIRSPVIFLQNPRPIVPIDLTWTFVLSAPILYLPDGTFRSSWLERQVAPEGGLRQEVTALVALEAAPKPPPVDVVVSPQLLDQLERMRRGYTVRTDTGVDHVAAGRDGAAGADLVLRDLRSIAASSGVELSAMPFADPSIPALMSSGLAGDVATQLTRGDQEVQAVLGRGSVPGLLHPPDSRLDQASLYELHQNGVRLLLVDDDTVQEPSPSPRSLGFAKPAVAGLSIGTSSPLRAVVPDHGVQQLLASGHAGEDSRLAVQSVLGELAAIWLERPSVPRGTSLILSERTPLPGAFFGQFTHMVGGAPWVRRIRASAMAAVHPPPTDRPAELIARSGPRFSAAYLSALAAARQRVRTYRSLVADNTALPDRLDQLLLVAEAGQFASSEQLGEEFLGQVTARLQTEFTAVRPNTTQPITLTSHTGNVPVPIQNRTGHTVKVRVQLQSNRLFPDGDSPPQLVQVPADGTVLTFHVQARTSGRFPVVVKILTPDGQTVISEGRLVVRSTAYNVVALVITIGAALFLLALWARRLIPWTKR